LDIETFVKLNFEVVRRSGDEVVLNPCPGCGDTHHFYFNVRKGLGYCFKCGFAANIFQLKKRFKREVIEDREPVKESAPTFKISLPSMVRNADLINYMQSRFVPLKRIRDYQIGLCTRGLYRDRVIIPVCECGRIAGFVARSVNGAKRKYLYPKGFKVKQFLFNYENVAPEREIILVEGVFDVLRHPYQTLALFGKTISKVQIKKVLQKKPSRVYVCLDPDATKEALKVAEAFFMRVPTYLVRLEKDPGDTDEETFQRALQNASRIDQYSHLRFRLITCEK